MPEKVIWMFWDKGLDTAPELVKLCVQSWIAHNPTWKVLVLDAQSVLTYVDLAQELGEPAASLPIQKLAVVLRLSLLARYGGVWADCTSYCMKPLDAWLPPYVENGFFAFRDPAPDRLLANWFLAARKGDLLATEFHRITLWYFREHHFPPQDTRIRARIVRRLGTEWNVNAATTRHWFSWPMRRLLRLYPYFVNHYLFAELLRRDARCRAQWAAGPALPAAPMHTLQDCADHQIERARQCIEHDDLPMHKLNWRADFTKPYWTEVFALLGRSIQR